MSLNAEQKEMLRHIVLGVLAPRAPNALNRQQILVRAAQEVDIEGGLSVVDIVTALEYLRGMTPALVERVEDGMGPSNYWKSTTAGINAVERDERPGRPARHD